MATTETEVVQQIGNDYKYGFHDERGLLLQVRAAGSRPRSSRRSRSTRTSRTGCGSSASSRWSTSWRARCPSGAAICPRSTSTTSTTTSSPTEKQANTWEDLPPDIKDTWDKLGIPEAEKKFLAGVGAQYESEVVYHKLQENLEAQGVIFLDMDSGLREHEELVKQYFGTIIPQNDNKFAALNSAVWSGGSFIYVPPGVKIEMPLQAYFRINAENMGQFERTLIIVDEGAYVHYVEGCTAPIYSTDSLHSAVVEIIVKRRRPLPLHDDPELVEQRLQPGHQARRRLRGRDDGVGRRQPRLQADDEVPGDLAARRSARTARCSRSPSPARASTRTRAARPSTSRRTRPR